VGGRWCWPAGVSGDYRQAAGRGKYETAMLDVLKLFGVTKMLPQFNVSHVFWEI
jgi:hypothetical protein